MMSTTGSPAAWVLPLASNEASLATAGGKGANLARLAQAGLRVPDGFVITTEAYLAFAAENGLPGRIAVALENAAADDAEGLERVSTQIRQMFGQGALPAGLAERVLAAHAGLGRPAVAVRSSATAEDLPEMSFAGQQDTYLNVVGDESLLAAVRACWGSLWTARAIGYRLRNGVPHAGVGLAVVVQQMVESEASGVLFTANPLTGLRTETVIDATLGLGEALVSGQVEPDHYVVDTLRAQITARTLGAKAVAARARPGGGTATVAAADGASCQALPDPQVLELARLGGEVAALYGGTPQDIEWAWAGGTLYLLQARPITSLYPLPAGLPAEPLQVMFSFAAVQGMLDPITPLGQDSLRQIFAAAARVFGMRRTRQTQRVLHTAGERLWINVTLIMRTRPGRAAMQAMLGWAEPTIHQAVNAVWDDPRLQPARRGLRPGSAARLARFALPVAGNVLLNLASPERRRAKIAGHGEALLEIMRQRCAAVAGPPRARLAQLSQVIPATIDEQLPRAFVLYFSGIASGMVALNLVRMLVSGAKALPGPSAAPSSDSAADERGGSLTSPGLPASPPGLRLAGRGTGRGPMVPERAWDDRVLETTRGLPHNPTTEMDLALWRAAEVIRGDPASLAAWGSHTPAELAGLYQAGALPPAAQYAAAGFLARYGARGLAEFDIGRPRWAEDPGPVFEALSGYMQIADAAQAPDAVFRRGAGQAAAAIQELAAGVAVGPRGRLKARLLRWAAGRMRALLSMREMPKFFAVRLLGVARRELLAAGGELAQAGELDRPDDLFYLTYTELADFAAGAAADWRGRVAARREAYRRELLRRQIPRLLLSDGRAFYEGLAAPAGEPGVLQGSPVSPGAAEGRVRVVLDPRAAGLQPGEVLVCPGTDPSWTPLFLLARALVMEVGGLMTHGAVVAREYGIPAVVGVHQATTRLRTGQRVQVNGSNGLVVILDEDSSEQ